ncbi:MAG: ATP-binding cassette domain-containing protein [Defluviitaleaceae bacterium]|nr:ATP-binding cassette domain-containing protein [Defluviitaleaceae bacterium]
MRGMMFSAEGLCKSFGEKKVLKGVGFRVESGSALGLLGRNGAGKTTTLRIIADIFRPDEGRITLDGAVLDYSKVRMGYLPEERGLYPKIKVGEQMVYIGMLKGMDHAAAKKSAGELLEGLGASEYWSKKLETLSKGNQQKIQLAISVLHDPDLIILDEPFSGLDPVNAQSLKDLITKQVERGKIVIFSSHQMPYVEEFCQHICILNKGGIVLDGNIKDIKKTYVRDKIDIVPEKNPGQFLEEASRQDGWANIVEEASAQGGSVRIVLKSPENKRRLFNLLGEHGQAIDSFSVVEPTLEEIFVEKAGESQ